MLLSGVDMFFAEHSANVRPEAGGIPTLIFGVVISAFGISSLLNFRGWAQGWYRSYGRPQVPAWLERIPPWKGSDHDLVPLMRFMVWGSAILGPVLVIIGVVRILSGHP